MDIQTPFWSGTEQEAATAYYSWFITLDPIFQIVVGILSVIAIAGFFYLIFGAAVLLVQAVFYLVGLMLKAVFVGVSVMFYTMITLFIKTPLAILDKRSVEQVWTNYIDNVEHFILQIFKEKPKESKEQTNDNKQLPSRPNIPKTQITQVKTSEGEKMQYHCNSCGKLFTPTMNLIMTKQLPVYCENCGQKFLVKNSIPQPID